MADNTQVAAGAGDTVRDKDRAGVKTQIVGLDLGIGGASEVLQTAAALADAAANPTIPAWAMHGLLFNGTTWDRMRGDITNGLDVDVTRVQGSVTVAQATAANLKVDASSAAVPVTDNGGSLTVDAPVGTPLRVDPTGTTAQPVTPPTLTKATQGATGFSVQNLKDAGRVTITWTVDNFVTTAAAEALLTVTESRDMAATTTFTTKVITSGKRLRITSIMVSATAGGTTPAVSRLFVRIRANSAGAVTTASPLQHILALGTSATAKAIVSEMIDFPDGIEFAGDGTRQIGISVQSADWVATTNTPQISVAITGFEY